MPEYSSPAVKVEIRFIGGSHDGDVLRTGDSWAGDYKCLGFLGMFDDGRVGAELLMSTLATEERLRADKMGDPRNALEVYRLTSNEIAVGRQLIRVSFVKQLLHQGAATG